MVDLLDEIEVSGGEARDYDLLGAHHYVAGRPARPVRVLTARHGARIVGVLVVSMPTLNSSVRELAWPGRYRTGSKRQDAARVNRELRCISRVVVEPRWRGLGVARRLVSTYLADPATPATEAVAAMGRICPFFERAGMTAYSLARRAADARLIDALEHVGALPTALVDVARAEAVAGHPFVQRELRLWANATRATRGLVDAPARDIAVRAGVRVCARPMGYAHVWRGRHERTTTEPGAG